MNRAVRVEWWKLKRSPVTVTATALMVILLPAMALGFYSVAQQGGTGPLAQKAGAFLIGEGWEGYLGAVDQIAAAAMFLGTGFVVAWTFGREHTDRTFPSLFALPVSRTSIAGAKFLVLAGWITLLSLLVVAVSLGIGVAAGSPSAARHLPIHQHALSHHRASRQRRQGLSPCRWGSHPDRGCRTDVGPVWDRRMVPVCNTRPHCRLRQRGRSCVDSDADRPCPRRNGGGSVVHGPLVATRRSCMTQVTNRRTHSNCATTQNGSPITRFGAETPIRQSALYRHLWVPSSRT